MADQQNPIQNDQATSTGSTSGTIPAGGDVTTGNDLLGDISLSNPVAPESSDEVKTSDLSDMLVEKTLDTIQQKAEESSEEGETTEWTMITPAPAAEVALSAPATAAPVNNDPMMIDLGDIHIPSEEIQQPTKDNLAATTISTDEQPSGMFKNTTEEKEEEPVAPAPVVEAPIEMPAVPAVEIPAAPVEEAVVPTLDIPAAETAAEEAATPEITAPEAPADAPVVAEASALATATEPMINLDIPAATEEKSDTMIDSLTSNEQAQVVAVNDATAQAATEQPAQEEMTLDLDSLTSDLTPTAPANVATSDVVSDNATPVIPAVASATLPEMTLVQSTPHGSAKKKAFAMIAAFLLLLGVGGFVFKTMMPEEANKLFANIMGFIPIAQTVEQTTPETTDNTTPEIPAAETADSTATQSDVDTLLATTGNDDTSALTEDDTAIDVPTNNDTATETPATAETNSPETATNISTTTTINIDQAKNTLSALTQKAKKTLAVALKNDQKNAADILYKVFKDGTNLLETLANTNDISTIPDVEKQIADLQQAFNQANIILNVAGSKHAES